MSVQQSRLSAGGARAAALRVLLLEPDTAAAMSLGNLLQAASGKPITIEHAATLEAGLASLHEHAPDAVITELELPDSSGNATLAQLVAADPHLPIVVLADSEDDGFALELLKHGAQDYLVKGRSDAALVLKTLRYAIERKESDQHLTFLSHYDRLTGLANRELFRDRLHQAMTRAERSDQLVALMFIGGCAGSTAGGVKVGRVVVFFKTLRRQMVHSFRPNQIIPVRINGVNLNDGYLLDVMFFLSLTGVIVALSTLAVSVLEPQFSLVSSFTAVAATLFNIGPGLDAVGPMMNYAGMGEVSHLLLSALMIMGRLEIFAVLVLFVPLLWRRF